LDMLLLKWTAMTVPIAHQQGKIRPVLGHWP
jgi:hypothetical protein